jgi:diguanylate cyclase (GGDEF)-like protein
MARKDQHLPSEAPPPSAFLQSLIDSLPAAVLVLDTAGVIRYAAGQLNYLGDRTYAQLVGSRVSEHVASDDERRLIDELIRVTASRAPGETVGPTKMLYLDADGRSRLAEVWAVNRATDPVLGGIVVILLPESAHDRFDQVLASITNGASLDQVFTALAEALHFPPSGGDSYFLTPASDDRGVRRYPEDVVVPGPPLPGPWDDIFEGTASVEYENLARVSSSLREAAGMAGYRSLSCFAVHPGPDGHADACLVVWSRDEAKLCPYARLAAERAVVIATLAMSHRSEEDGLIDAAFRDPLTGLGNRRSFFQALDAQVQAKEQPAILYIDLDGFKAVNDNLGHLAGDAVLRVAARRLASIMRPTDELARLGGDEFAVLCNGAPSADQMVMIAERVVEQLSRPLSVGDGRTVDVGASIGIALDLPISTPLDTILARADHALLEAKAKGKGKWAIASMPEG